MAQRSSRADSLWRHYPWLGGLLLAPFAFGCVTIEGQVVVALLFGASLFLLAPELKRMSAGGCPPWWCWLALLLLVMPLIPLPVGLTELLSPERVRLARAFPVFSEQTPFWLSPTVSPAHTIQRLWEISLVIAGFALARHAATHPRFPQLLAWGIAGALVLLTVSDAWLRRTGGQSVLGIWPITWGQPGGTFASRNHFANWLYVGILFSLGSVLRASQPLHAARSPHCPLPHRSGLQAALLLVAVVSALVAGVASGSRGGFAAFLTGMAVWTLLIARRARSRLRWWATAAVMIIALLLIAGTGDFLIRRLAQTKADLLTHYPKLETWRQSGVLLARFPVLGTGWGTFATAFNHYKTSGGQATFYHAENDYLEVLVETGLIGAAVFGSLLACLLLTAMRLGWSQLTVMSEPELVFGALAGLAGFAVHAAFDSIAVVTANALLAAVFLGFILGQWEQTLVPVVRPPPSRKRMLLTGFWGAGLAGVALLQGDAVLHWWMANAAVNADDRVTHLRSALARWPWATHRQIALTRAEVELLVGESRTNQMAQVKALWTQLSRTLTRDPFNWELWLERTWLDLAFSTNAPRALVEARLTALLNPLQPFLPLRFARHWAKSDPDVAWEFLRSAACHETPYGGDPLNEALALAWQVRADTDALWALTPNTPHGLLTLGDFALAHDLRPLAAQAFLLLTNRLDALTLARKLLLAQRPDLAASLIGQPPTSRAEQLLLAQARHEEKSFDEAIRWAQSVWLSSPAAQLIQSPAEVTASSEALLAEWKAQPQTPRLAARLAEAVCREPPVRRDLALLRQVAQHFPDNLRLQWLVLQTELALHQKEAAARTALELAMRVATLYP
jgi:hypothetical protein